MEKVRRKTHKKHDRRWWVYALPLVALVIFVLGLRVFRKEAVPEVAPRVMTDGVLIERQEKDVVSIRAVFPD